MRPLGLQRVPTDDLKQLLRIIHREAIGYPITADQLACVGLQHRAEELLHVLRGLDAAAVRAVVVCVLAERMPRQ